MPEKKITLREVCHNLTIILQKKLKKNLERGKDFKEAFFYLLYFPIIQDTQRLGTCARVTERFESRVSS